MHRHSMNHGTAMTCHKARPSRWTTALSAAALLLLPGLALTDQFTLAKAKRAKALAKIEQEAQGTVPTLPNNLAKVVVQRSQASTVPATPELLGNKTQLFPRPNKIALLVILENGGIVNNLDPALRSQLNASFILARCQNVTLELRASGDLAGMIQQISAKLQQLPQCLNPGNWRLENYTLRRWIDETSDQMLENTVKGVQAFNNARAKYDIVELFEDANATPDRVMARMKELAPTHLMDIHVLTHGSSGFFIGGNHSSFDQTRFFGPLAAGERALEYRLFIRSVYQMNCKSGSLIEEWASIGAETVNSVQGNNMNNMPWQYFHFFGKWINESKSFELATRDAYNEAKLYTTPVFTLIGMANEVAKSELRSMGNDSITVSQR